MSTTPVHRAAFIPPATDRPSDAAAPARAGAEPASRDGRLREAFDAFVGETFYGQMLAAMRKTVGEPAYLHGGRAEQVFQGQLDQLLAERMSKASAETFTGPLFNLFMLPRP